MKTSSRRKFLKTAVTSITGVMLVGSASPVAALENSSASTEPNTFNILDFGAIGDGKTMNTPAIQKAIDACTQQGGGRVIVPKGTFITGGFIIKSNVNLHLEENAVILGSPYMKDYEPQIPLYEARYQKYLGYALVFAQGAKNISVSGLGILNGNAQLGGELNEFLRKQNKVTNKGGVGGRPLLLWFDECENILVKAITFKNSSAWTQTYSRCRNIHVDNIKVTENYYSNADGCNIVDCEDFIIENCDINTMDDGICLKGFTKKGCKRGIIRNNKVRSLCNGIKMGTDSSGGFRDILIENNTIWETGISGIALELTDGGIMENITVKNITMDVVATPLFIKLGNRNRPLYGQLTVPIGAIRNVNIHGIKATVDYAKRFNELERTPHHNELIVHTSSITGFPENDVHGITIEDIDITIRGGFPLRTVQDTQREIPEDKKYPENRMFGVLPAYGFFIRHVRNLLMKNITINIEQKDGRPAFFLDDVHESEFDNITTKNVITTPAFSVNQNCSSIMLNR